MKASTGSKGTAPAKDDKPGAPHVTRHGTRVVAATAIAALGVVFGDIGTSPLYALKTVFLLDGGAVRANQSDVFGVISLMFWSITIIVSIKYLDHPDARGQRRRGRRDGAGRAGPAAVRQTRRQAPGSCS